VAVVNETTIASGGSERSVLISSLTAGSGPEVIAKLELTLRCDGALVDGLKGPKERAQLERLLAVGGQRE
jgi:hypothetical protein